MQGTRPPSNVPLPVCDVPFAPKTCAIRFRQQDSQSSHFRVQIGFFFSVLIQKQDEEDVVQRTGMHFNSQKKEIYSEKGVQHVFVSTQSTDVITRVCMSLLWESGLLPPYCCGCVVVRGNKNQASSCQQNTFLNWFPMKKKKRGRK